MNIRPECDSFIHFLIVKRALCQKYLLEEYKEKKTKADEPYLVVEHYECPHCDEVLFEDKDEAKEFLNKI
jgi:coproporphyrinogen III oxidase